MSNAPRQPVTPATAAEWRRRRETSAERPPPNGTGLPPNGTESPRNGTGAGPNGAERPRNGFRIPAYAATVRSREAAPVRAARQEASISALLSIAEVTAPSRPAPPPPPPAREPHPQAPAGPAAPQTASLAGPARAHQEANPPGSGAGSLNALPLTVILTVQTVLALRLTWSNTAFTDEALYLWAGRLEWSHWLHGTPVPDFAAYLSGAPTLYPALGALASSLGGLAGARLLSLCFMLGATVLIHGVTRRVFDRRSAVFAAALFAGLGSAQFLSAFATYDAMALFLLATATWLGIRAAQCRTIAGWLALLLLAAASLVAAAATKYAAALFDPVVLTVITCFNLRERGRRGGIAAALAVSATAAATGAAALAWAGKAYATGVFSTTLSRPPGNWPMPGILFVSAGWVGAVAAMAVIGAVASFRHSGVPHQVLTWALAAAAFLAPAEQARIHVYTSLFKHVGFGGWFACAAAGYALTAFTRAVPVAKARGAIQAAAVLIVVSWIAGLALAAGQFGGWPSMSPVLPELASALRAHPGPLLVDGVAPFDYYLIGTEPWQRIAAIPPSSATAEAQLVRQRTYSVIVLSYTVGGGGCGNSDPAVKSTQAGCPHYADLRMLGDLLSYGGYQLIARIPYRTTAYRSAYMVWVREGPR